MEPLRPPVPPQTPSFRVMTYNVLNGGRGREADVLSVIQSIAPDVVVLQEVFDREFVKGLADAMNMQWYFAPGNTRWHLALLSRWPIVAGESHHPFPPVQQTVLEATVEGPLGKHIHVFGMNAGPLPNVLCELWRRWEVSAALRRATKYTDSLCLLVGDFNSVAPGDRPAIERMRTFDRVLILLQGNRLFHFAVRSILAAGMADCFRDLHQSEDGFTVPVPAPNVRLDYVFANAPMRATLKRCFVVREPVAVRRASDHYPVVADFTL